MLVEVPLVELYDQEPTWSGVGKTTHTVATILGLAMAGPRQVPAMELPVQPQRRREQLRTRLAQDARSAADAVINRLKLKHGGRKLARLFPGNDAPDVIVVISLVNGWINKQMNLETGEREQASAEQLEIGLERIPDAVDAISKLITAKLKD